MQYLLPVEVGPSSNTCPRCEPHCEQVISVRVMPCDVSRWYSTASGSACSNDGQPVPESNFASDEKSGFPHAAHAYVPSALSWRYSPVNAVSVPLSRRMRYRSGVRIFLHSSSLCGIGFLVIRATMPSTACGGALEVCGFLRRLQSRNRPQ